MGLPKDKGLLAPHQAHQPRRFLLEEDEPPEHLALKASGAYFQESQRAMRNRDSSIRGCTQNLSPLSPVLFNV